MNTKTNDANIRISKEARKRLRIAALKKEITLKALVERLSLKV